MYNYPSKGGGGLGERPEAVAVNSFNRLLECEMGLAEECVYKCKWKASSRLLRAVYNENMLAKTIFLSTTFIMILGVDLEKRTITWQYICVCFL